MGSQARSLGAILQGSITLASEWRQKLSLRNQSSRCKTAAVRMGKATAKSLRRIYISHKRDKIRDTDRRERQAVLSTPMGVAGHFGESFAHAAVGFAVTAFNGMILHANRSMAKIIDCEADDVTGVNLLELIHPDDRLQHNQLLQQLLASEIPGYVIEKRYLRPDGTAVWVRESVSLAGKESPAAGYVVCISEDISDRKHAARILERQEQMAAMGRLTSSIIHEINNPLEAIGNLIYLANHSANLSEARLYLQTAEEELSRASEITMQGLQFHRQSPNAKPANVVEMMRTVLVLFRGKFRRARVRDEFAATAAAEILCFPGELRQVFVNLIGNAIESMPEGGLLNIRVRPATDWRTGSRGVRVTVADTGSGMSEETRKHIFKAFYTTKGADGSGLGLWVTANIVRKHEGSIHVRSSHMGTVFTLVFPYRGAEGKTAGFQDAA